MKDLIYSQARLIDSLPAHMCCRYKSIDLSAVIFFLPCRIRCEERTLTAVPAEYCRGLNEADQKMPVGIEPTIQGLRPCAFIHTWLRHRGMKNRRSAFCRSPVRIRNQYCGTIPRDTTCRSSYRKAGARKKHLRCKLHICNKIYHTVCECS